jgi:hypothetical protein
MSISHRANESELDESTIAQALAILGAGDTPQLYQRGFSLDTAHDICTGACNSLDRKTVYIDRTLFATVMDGEYKATGLEPKQIIRLWCEHEHSEKAMVDGDNPVDFYTPAHTRALAIEHAALEIIVGPGKRRLYEDTIWPGLDYCYNKQKITKPPKDMWCGPLNDEVTERDEELLEILAKLGVVDATKHSKRSSQYGFNSHSCKTCRHFNPDFISQQGGALAACYAVSGLVREDRGSVYWAPKRNMERPK